MDKNCIFCKISLGEIPAKKIYENRNFFSMPDKSPKVKGHSLIISKKHFFTTLDLPQSLGSELLDCIKETALILMKQTNASGFNIVQNNFASAGQVVNHAHFHILPRKSGDGIKFIE